jgi:hypothetical protein
MRQHALIQALILTYFSTAYLGASVRQVGFWLPGVNFGTELERLAEKGKRG